jgi:subtilisin-like proprotein convertase family protein
VTLRNAGTAGATGIAATLGTTTPGVTVEPTNSTSTYPDIAPGGTGTNATPFRITTSPAFVVGTRIAFTLNVTTGQGPFVINFSVPTGTLGAPVNILYSGPPVAIPDNNPAGASAPIVVSGITGSVGRVTATVFINHTWDADLNLTLIAPDGTPVPLSTARGGQFDNFGTNCPADANDTTWDDAAATAIGSGAAPFVGSFRPETPLSALNAKNPNGTWQFKGVDTANLDTGAINCVKLTITPVTGTDGGGACGAPPPVGKFYALPPCRVADTRTTTPPALGANTLRTFPAAGVCSIPADATAIAIVATVVGETDFGDLRIFPAGLTPIPLASTLNFAVNHVKANNAIVPLGTAGEIGVQCDMPTGSTGTTHFLFDVFGYFK